jgi:hypothetical protein
MSENYRLVEVTLDEYLMLGDAGVWVVWGHNPSDRDDDSWVDTRPSDHTSDWWHSRDARIPFYRQPNMFKWYTRIECDE